ncbi:MAG: peptidylprolyl isomerase [Rickettsiales bacterium]|jgi:peptidylprolyl isomerase|nr:peptidylprolyl isomerase [Rickettsiales bacterium]
MTKQTKYPTKIKAKKVIITITAALLIAVGCTISLNTKQKDGQMENKANNTIYLELKDGTVEIELYPEIAPKTVARIIELTNNGFYNGIKFHRVIPGFMAQTGDPTGTGMGGSGQNLPAEFNKLSHTRGVVSMARAQDINSADSQFFIVFDNASFLDGQYTGFGKVIKGMEFVDKIKAGSQYNNGQVENPDTIIRMYQK